MNEINPIRVLLWVVLLIVVVSGGGLWGYPQWNVYSQKMDGEAKLAHSQYERQVQVVDAEGKLQAAKSLALVDVERARGVAQANQIIGQSLRQNENYLKWLYIESLKDNTSNQIIYIPTEAGLPILEAGKRKNANP